MKAEKTNRVVVVGGDAIFLALVDSAARTACVAKTIAAPDLATVATTVTEKRPFAIVVARAIHDFGGPDLDALARDVGAELLVVPETIASPVLSAMILEAASTRLG